MLAPPRCSRSPFDRSRYRHCLVTESTRDFVQIRDPIDGKRRLERIRKNPHIRLHRQIVDHPYQPLPHQSRYELSVHADQVTTTQHLSNAIISPMAFEQASLRVQQQKKPALRLHSERSINSAAFAHSTRRMMSDNPGRVYLFRSTPTVQFEECKSRPLAGESY